MIRPKPLIAPITKEEKSSEDKDLEKDDKEK